MKVLITSDWNIDAINGVVTSILNLKDELEKLGHEVKILTLSPSFENEKKADVYMVGSISAERVYHKARLRIRRGKKLVDEICSWKPDIIHSQCEFSSFFLAKEISRRLSIPLVHTCHTVYEDYVGYVLPHLKALGIRGVREIFRYCSKYCDLFIAPTEKVKRILLSYPVICPVEVVPTGIKIKSYDKDCDREKIEEIKKEYNIEGKKILLYLGRLAKEKNISELLNFISELKRDDISFLIVGDGPYRNELEEEANKLGLTRPKVIFTGMVKPEDVHFWYESADLFINASQSETQGLTYIEALSSALPLLVRKDECLEGVVEDGINGWKYNNKEEFFSYLDQYFASSDKALMRENAKKKAMNFSSSNFASHMEGIYNSLIEVKNEQ